LSAEGETKLDILLFLRREVMYTFQDHIMNLYFILYQFVVSTVGNTIQWGEGFLGTLFTSSVSILCSMYIKL